ncbi:hypothetical protein DXV76_16620 [Rhodobacteraceae bacterium CCMM004]|nr:hypothetical protein DXV76_16620 [Rhodobacteraceae bacterium CCMM004]
MAGTFTEAYRQAGYAIANPRNQWSALSADGTRVAMTVWSDEIDKSSEPWVVDIRDHPRLEAWGGRTGNAIRKKHIAHALVRCAGRVDLILCVAEDPTRQPRRIKIARHWPQRIGRLDPDGFDPETGTFRLWLDPA